MSATGNGTCSRDGAPRYVPGMEHYADGCLENITIWQYTSWLLLVICMNVASFWIIQYSSVILNLGTKVPWGAMKCEEINR